ncbi:hypothetical protein OPT61_g5443 [Boeremia exigua]|uniref:Uncharacterized protein n=1 Tax=Boeremia exigua TaxID=749465 RepID=A0ACC2IAE4_9PLEO|nr:hypothetical protein OPT61_g5443 [Boeremia exigua]
MRLSFQDVLNAVFLWQKPQPETEVRNEANPDERLRLSLDALCQLPENRTGITGQRLQTIATENVQRVSETLQSLHMSRWRREDTVTWNHRPRTYIILHNLNLVHLMNNFVKDGMTDLFLPYNDVTLPDYVQPAAVRVLFLEVQQYLLTDARVLEHLTGGVSSTKVLPHIHLSEGGDRHFKRLRMLGKGSFGKVEEVYSCLSHKRYARKTVVRSRTNGPAQKDLVKELEALKSLSHRHLVKALGSYTDAHHIAYLMLPVAQGNLDDLLRKPGGLTESDKHDIRSFFGCLAGAANYLHRSRIRHRDLSLKNILVHDGSVFISDFGSAYKWAGNNNQGSVTHHHIVPATRFYMAPEIAKNAARNSSSDMWSLGVIFLEMTTLLVGRTLTQLRSKLSDNLRQNIEPYLWANPRVVTDWLQILQEANQGPAHDNEPLEWIRDLLHTTPKNDQHQSEFRDRRFKDNDSQIGEEVSGDATDIIQNVAHLLEEVQQPVLMSSRTHSTIQTWLSDTEVPISERPNIAGRDIGEPDHVLSSRMPGEFGTDDDGETTSTESETESFVDHTAQFLVVDSSNTQSLPAIVAPSIVEGHISPLRCYLGHSQASSLSAALEYAKDTGLGFFEIDSPSSSIDGIREISDSSGSDAGSDSTSKQLLMAEHACDCYSEDRRWSVLERPRFAGDVDKPLQLLDSLDSILEVSDDSDDDGTGNTTGNGQTQILPQLALDFTVTPADSVIVETKSQVDPETDILTLIEPSKATGTVDQTLGGIKDGDMQVELNNTQEDVVGAKVTPASPVHGKESEQEAQSVEVSALDRNTIKTSEDPIPPAAPGADLGSVKPSDHSIVRHEKNSGKKRSESTTQIRQDGTVTPIESQGETGRLQAAPREQHLQPSLSAVEHGTNDMVLMPQIQRSASLAEGSADQSSPTVSCKQQEYDFSFRPAEKDGVVTVKPKKNKKTRATSIKDQTPKPPPRPVTEPSEIAHDDWKQPTVETGSQILLIESEPQKKEELAPQVEEAVSIAEVHANDQMQLDEDKLQKKKKKKKSSLHVTFAEESPARPIPTAKDEHTLRLEIDPSDYIQCTWETASSVATSVMSDKTKRMLQGFSLPRWWDHDHKLLEVFCSQGKAQAVRVLLGKGCNPGKAGPKGKRRSGPITAAIKGASLRHNKCVKALIEADADVNVVNHSSGKTPLHLAIENPRFRGYEHLICALIDGGANPNHADIRGDRPITKILLENGNGPLEEHHQKALALLLRDKATDVEVTQPGTLNTPLHLAVRRKDPFAAAMLLFKKANINAKNATGSTPLLVAANQLHNPTSKDQKQLMSILLHAKGILVNEKTGVKEQTALHYAVNAGASWAVDMLLEHDADPASEDKEGRNALALAQIHAEDDNWSPEDRDSILSRLQRASLKNKIPEVRGVDAVPPKRPGKMSARMNKPASSSAQS